MAQEATPEATQIVRIDAPVGTGPALSEQSFDLGETLPILGGIAILIALLGSFYILNIAIKALSVSVPQDVIHKIGESLVNNMNETMKTLADKAAETPTPIDDIVVELGKIPLEALIAEIQKRNADPSPQV